MITTVQANDTAIIPYNRSDITFTIDPSIMADILTDEKSTVSVVDSYGLQELKSGNKNFATLIGSRNRRYHKLIFDFFDNPKNSEFYVVIENNSDQPITANYSVRGRISVGSF